MDSSSIAISTLPERTRRQIETLRRDGGRITLEDDGAPVAALISLHELEQLELLDHYRREDWKLLHEIRAAFGDVPEDELMNEALKAQREAREDMDLERAAATEANQAAGLNLSKEKLLRTAELAIRRARDRRDNRVDCDAQANERQASPPQPMRSK